MTEGIFGLIGVIIGAIIAPSIEWFRSRLNTKKNAQYLAIRVICILDEFVNKCCEIAGDTGTCHPDGTIYFRAELPEIITFPENLNWTVIDHKLMYRILNFPNTIQNTFKYLDHRYQENFPYSDEASVERQYEFSRLGLEAAEIAQDLRRRYCIPQEFVNFRNPDWDALKYLMETKEKIDDQSTNYLSYGI